MRILFYNWANVYDPVGRGGGVAVYQRNLAEHFEHKEGFTIKYLSAGIFNDFFKSKARWQRARVNKGGPWKDHFEIINSKATAPAHFSYGMDAQVEDQGVVDAFEDFIEKEGPFDIIHFNNLEGLPANVLTLKSKFPNTKFLLSMHNYYPFCPQVNLWFSELISCSDFKDGEKCVNCIWHYFHTEHIHAEGFVEQMFARFGMLRDKGILSRYFFHFRVVIWFLKFALSKLSGGRLTKFPPRLNTPSRLENKYKNREYPIQSSVATADYFKNRRAVFVDYINKYCDAVIGVSDRVSEITRSFGVRSDIVKTLYIGTQQAEVFYEQKRESPIFDEDGCLHIAYLGYMRRDKGYYFLLEALAALPKKYARRIKVTVAARSSHPNAVAHLYRTLSHFNETNYYDGYTHNDLDEILAPVTLGIIPSLWEDNLPQTAIEMHARRIRLLVSDMGGAPELGNFPDLVFKADSKSEFIDKLIGLLDKTLLVDKYWKSAMPPKTMLDHSDELLELYNEAL